MAATAQSRIEVLEVGPLEILPAEHLARADGHALMLSIRELRLLTELARRADRIMPREELFSLVWGREMRPGDRSVDVYVRKLRVKLQKALPSWRFIHTHFGFGYRLSAEPQRHANNRFTTGCYTDERLPQTLAPHQAKETTMRKRRISAVSVALAASLVVAACGSSSSSSSSSSGGGSGASTSSSSSSGGGGSATLNGAGSTLAAPIYQQWGSTLKSQGLTINYNPVGSGTGIADLQTATVDFAGSDPALKSTDTSAMKGPALQFPVAFGAITVSYNLSGVKSGLKLDGATIADIFLGKIKTWNDPAIKTLNPGITLPSTAITVVHRSDSSGTTKGFTTFLEDYSPTWKSQVGADKDVKWPTGTGAAKNSGVAAAVKQTDGAIGYVEQAYAIENNFTYASVKNSSGSYVLPTIANTSAAAVGIPIPADLGISTINSKNAAAYPIVSQTFLVVYKDPCKDGGASQSVASGLKTFLTYAFGDGQKTLGASSSQLPYAPLPADLVSKDTTQLATMTCNGSPLS